MYQINLSDTMLIMAAASFFLGMCTMTMGIFVLVTRSSGRDASSISAQTAKLARKGFTEDMAGLLDNASNLMAAMNSMVRTAAGIGIFLTTLGLGLMGAGFWMVLQVDWPV